MEEPLALTFIQYTAMQDVRCGKLKFSDNNPSVLVEAGLDVHIGTNDDMDNNDNDDDNYVDRTNPEPVVACHCWTIWQMTECKNVQVSAISG